MRSKYSSFKSAHHVSTRLFSAYQQQIKKHQQIQQLICSVVPKSLATHIQYSLINDESVVIYTDSAIWSSQIRFLQSQILKKLHQTGFNHISILKLKVLNMERSTTQPTDPIYPDLETIDLITQVADSHQTDRLGEAMQRLSNTLKKKSAKL